MRSSGRYTPLYDDFRTHPKLRAFRRRTKRSEPQVFFSVALLLQAARRYDPAQWVPDDVKFFMAWPGPEEPLVEALIETGWMDRAEDGSLRVHELELYSGPDGKELEAKREVSRATKKEKERLRSQARRDAAKAAKEGEASTAGSTAPATESDRSKGKLSVVEGSGGEVERGRPSRPAPVAPARSAGGQRERAEPDDGSWVPTEAEAAVSTTPSTTPPAVVVDHPSPMVATATTAAVEERSTPAVDGEKPRPNAKQLRGLGVFGLVNDSQLPRTAEAVLAWPTPDGEPLAEWAKRELRALDGKNGRPTVKHVAERILLWLESKRAAGEPSWKAQEVSHKARDWFAKDNAEWLRQKQGEERHEQQTARAASGNPNGGPMPAPPDPRRATFRAMQAEAEQRGVRLPWVTYEVWRGAKCPDPNWAAIEAAEQRRLDDEDPEAAERAAEVGEFLAGAMR